MLNELRNLWNTHLDNYGLTDEIIDYLNENTELLSSLEYQDYDESDIEEDDLQEYEELFEVIWDNCDDLFDFDYEESFQVLLSNLV